MVTFQGICLGACNLCKPVIQRPLDLFLIHLGELFHARVRPKPSFAKLPGMIHAIHEWDYLWATVSSFVFTSLQDWPLLVSTLCSGCGRSHCQNHDTGIMTCSCLAAGNPPLSRICSTNSYKSPTPKLTASH